MTREIRALVGRLKGIKWDWSESGMESLLASMGAALVDTVPGRRTYLLPDGPKVSLYAEHGRTEFLEATVDSFFDPQRLSPKEYEEKVDEYFSKYKKAVDAAAEVLGPPVFNNGGESEGFPEDQEAVWLAQWGWFNARFMIQQKHEDKELPFRLCVVIAPPKENS